MSARTAIVRPGLPPLQDADHAGVRDAGLHLDAEAPSGASATSAPVRVSRFESSGLLVHVLALRDRARRNTSSTSAEISASVGVRGGSGGAGGEQAGGGHDHRS